MVINLVPAKLDPLVSDELNRLKLSPAAIIPLDEEVYQYDLKMKPLLDLPDSSEAVKAVGDLMDKLLKAEKILTKRG